MDENASQVTRLLREWSDGNPEALDELLPLIIDEARDLARRAMALESPHHTLQPTALVNEAYMRLIGRKTYWWRDRKAFFSTMAELMRRILVDHARRRRAAKRGSGETKLSLDEGILATTQPHPDLVLLDGALRDLEAIDEESYRVVMLWFFMGLTQKEIARELDLSINTVGRRWQAARKWLYREIDRTGDDSPAPGEAQR